MYLNNVKPCRSSVFTVLIYFSCVFKNLSYNSTPAMTRNNLLNYSLGRCIDLRKYRDCVKEKAQSLLESNVI